MEDKEKILSEVDRLTTCYYNEKHGRSHNPLTRARLAGMIEALEIVHDYIGSMQTDNQEPANNVWHDAREEKPLDGSRVLTVQKENSLPSLCFYNKMKDVYGISHTSHNLIVYPSKWAYVEDLLKLGENPPKLPQISTNNEPVNVELEKELKMFLNSDEYINTLNVSGYLLIARHFVNWQKEQLMNKTLEFFYDQLNDGDMECGDIEKFIEKFKNKIEE